MDAARQSDRGAPPRELDDVTLMRVQRGDHEAFRALVECYGQRVLDLVWRILDPRGRGAAAEDLVQETFVRILGAIAGFELRGAAKLSTWILTIATRLALNELRRPRPAGEVPADHPAPGRTDAEVERRQLGAALRRALAELPDDQRAALLLHEVHGLDYDAIARAVGVALGTVRSRIARARTALRTRLREEGVR